MAKVLQMSIRRTARTAMSSKTWVSYKTISHLHMPADVSHLRPNGSSTSQECICHRICCSRRKWWWNRDVWRVSYVSCMHKPVWKMSINIWAFRMQPPPLEMDDSCRQVLASFSEQKPVFNRTKYRVHAETHVFAASTHTQLASICRHRWMIRTLFSSVCHPFVCAADWEFSWEFHRITEKCTLPTLTFSKNTRNRSGNLRRSVTRPIKLHAIFKLATRTIIVDRSNRGSLVCLRTSARTTCRCPCACEPMSQTQNKNNRNWHKQTNEFGLRKHEIRIRVEWRWGNRSADFIYMLLFIRRAFGKCSRACDPLLAAKRFSN